MFFQVSHLAAQLEHYDKTTKTANKKEQMQQYNMTKVEAFIALAVIAGFLTLSLTAAMLCNMFSDCLNQNDVIATLIQAFIPNVYVGFISIQIYVFLIIIKTRYMHLNKMIQKIAIACRSSKLINLS